MKKKLDETPVVIVFSFGSKETKGNESLAFAGASEANDAGRAIVITQKDIPKIEGVFFWYCEDYKLERDWHSTLWVATSAREICECCKFSKKVKVIVVAAPMHLKRCVRDLKKSGFEVMKMVSPKLESSWYEKSSLLPWTRSWWRWWSREIILRLLPWGVYKRLTLREK